MIFKDLDKYSGANFSDPNELFTICLIFFNQFIQFNLFQLIYFINLFDLYDI